MQCLIILITNPVAIKTTSHETRKTQCRSKAFPAKIVHKCSSADTSQPAHQHPTLTQPCSTSSTWLKHAMQIVQRKHKPHQVTGTCCPIAQPLCSCRKLHQIKSTHTSPHKTSHTATALCASHAGATQPGTHNPRLLLLPRCCHSTGQEMQGEGIT